MSSLNTLLGAEHKKLCDKKWFGSVEGVMRIAISYASRVFHTGARFFWIVSYSDDPTKACTYRSQVIWEEALARGIPMQQVKIYGTPIEHYRAKIRGHYFYFDSIPVPPEIPTLAYGWADDKFLLKQFLSARGIAVPLFACARNEKEAREAFSKIGGSGVRMVVKPRSGSRGRHTTVGVHTEEQALIAFTSANRLCAFVSLEEELVGPVCRATVVDGKLVGFFEAFPPTVVGDGVSSIRKLVENTNLSRPERVEPIRLSGEHELYLSRRGLNFDSIIPDGERTPLTYRTGRLFGGYTREMLGDVHPSLRGEVERAAHELAVPVVGFDLIIPNATEECKEQKWGIIEANTLPFIDLHYLPLYGTPSRVAEKVWDLWVRS